MSKEFIDKVAWIYIQDRKVLGARSKGKIPFYLPGGKRMDKETDLDVLSREIKEELSVDIDDSKVRFLGEFEAQAHGQIEGLKVVMKCYMCDYKGELNPSSEIEEIGWLSSGDIETDLTSPVDKLILKYLESLDWID